MNVIFRTEHGHVQKRWGRADDWREENPRILLAVIIKPPEKSESHKQLF